MGKDCDHITEGSGSIFLVSLAELIGLYKSTRSVLLHQDKELFLGVECGSTKGLVDNFGEIFPVTPI